MSDHTITPGLPDPELREDTLRKLLAGAESGDPESAYLLGEYHLRKDPAGKAPGACVPFYQQAADRQYTPAMVRLGQCLESGLGTKTDEAAAAKWYLAAANQGDAQGAFHFARMLETGRGVEKDDKKALSYYLHAAEKGIVPAQLAAGRYYRHHRWISSGNEEKAFHWFYEAAKQNNPIAQWNVGVSYEQGLGTEADPEQAARYYRLAAEQGHISGLRDWGRCLRDGIGVPADESRAFELLKQAADLNDPAAREEVAVCMILGLGTPKNIPAALRLCRRISGSLTMDEQRMRSRLSSRLEPAQRALFSRLEVAREPAEQTARSGPALWREKQARKTEQRNGIQQIRELNRYADMSAREACKHLDACLQQIKKLPPPLPKGLQAQLEEARARHDCKELEYAGKLARDYAQLAWADAFQTTPCRTLSAEIRRQSDALQQLENATHWTDYEFLPEHLEKATRLYRSITELCRQLGEEIIPLEQRLNEMKLNADSMLEHIRYLLFESDQQLKEREAVLAGYEDLIRQVLVGRAHMESLCGEAAAIQKRHQADADTAGQYLAEAGELARKWSDDATAAALEAARAAHDASGPICSASSTHLSQCQALLERCGTIAGQAHAHLARLRGAGRTNEEVREEVRALCDELQQVITQTLEPQLRQSDERQALAVRDLKTLPGLLADCRQALPGARAAVEEHYIDFGDADADASVAEANRLFRLKQRQKALAWLRRAAELGSAEARNELAHLHERGRQVPMDKAEAFRLYRAAAEQGYPLAECNLAICYAEGIGTEQNMELAIHWYRLAAGHGSSQAKATLEDYSRRGLLPPDPSVP